jgi:cell division protein FtsQ
MARRKNRYNKAVRRKIQRESFKRYLAFIARWVGILTVVAGVSGALVLAYFAVIRAPYFKIKGVEITGCKKVSRSELLKKMGITEETNILDLNLRKINQEIERIPWVERASIRRRLPDRLVVRIWEQEPRVLIHLDHLYYLNRAGKAFKKTQPGDDLNFPVITGLSKEAFFQETQRTREVVMRVLEILDFIEQNKVPFDLSQVSEIQVDGGDGLSLLVNQGNLKINLGLSSYQEKFRRLNVVREDLEKRGKWKRVKWIDLDLGDRVVVS